MKLLPWVIALGLSDASTSVYGHGGDLDPSFAQGGVARFAISDNGSCASGGTSVAVHPDGSIFASGWVGAGTTTQTLPVLLKIRPSGQIVSTYFVNEFGSGRAVIVNPANGVVYTADNVGNEVAVRAYLSEPFGPQSDFGSGGQTLVAAFGDTSHVTHANALEMNAGGTLFMAGDYDGGGSQKIALAMLNLDGEVLAAEAMGSGGPDEIATALAIQQSGRLITSGYGSAACQTQGFDVTFTDAFHFMRDTSFSSPNYAFGGSSGCFVDGSGELPDGSILEVGRVSHDDGSWQGMFQVIGPNGVVTNLARLVALSPWGDNSMRSVVIQPDGKWVIAGFTGVDASGTPGPWVGRFNADGSPDFSYGHSGATLIDFDPQDNAYGQALGAAIDRYGRVVIAGTYWTGQSDANGNDCTNVFVARLQSDDEIFVDGFDD